MGPRDGGNRWCLPLHPRQGLADCARRTAYPRHEPHVPLLGEVHEGLRSVDHRAGPQLRHRRVPKHTQGQEGHLRPRQSLGRTRGDSRHRAYGALPLRQVHHVSQLRPYGKGHDTLLPEQALPRPRQPDLSHEAPQAMARPQAVRDALHRGRLQGGLQDSESRGACLGLQHTAAGQRLHGLKPHHEALRHRHQRRLRRSGGNRHPHRR